MTSNTQKKSLDQLLAEFANSSTDEQRLAARNELLSFYESTNNAIKGVLSAPLAPETGSNQFRFGFDLDVKGTAPQTTSWDETLTPVGGSQSKTKPLSTIIKEQQQIPKPATNTKTHTSSQTQQPQTQRDNGGLGDKYEGVLGRKVGDVLKRNNYLDLPGLFAKPFKNTKQILFKDDGSDPEGKKPWLLSGKTVELNPYEKRKEGMGKRIRNYIGLGLLGAAAIFGANKWVNSVYDEPKEPVPIVQNAYTTIKGDDISSNLLDEPVKTEGLVTLANGTQVPGYHINLDEDDKPELFMVENTYVANSQEEMESVDEQAPLTNTGSISPFTFDTIDYTFPTLSYNFDSLANGSEQMWHTMPEPNTLSFGNYSSNSFGMGNSDMLVEPADPFGVYNPNITVEPADPLVDDNSTTRVDSPFIPNEATVNYLREVSNTYNRLGRNFSTGGSSEVLNVSLDVDKLPTDQYHNMGRNLTMALNHFDSTNPLDNTDYVTIPNASVIASELGMSEADVNRFYAFDSRYDSQSQGGRE